MPIVRSTGGTVSVATRALPCAAVASKTIVSIVYTPGARIGLAVEQDLAVLRRLEVLGLTREEILLAEFLYLVSLTVANPNEDRGLS